MSQKDHQQREWFKVAILEIETLSKIALVSSIDCLKINLKVRNVSSKVILPENDMSHMCIVKKMVRGRKTI